MPILYLTYLLVSYFSHNENKKYSKILHKANKAGPVVGAFLGSIPQCGFSAVMSNLYSRKIVTMGTLLAVFIATSDEAFPLMISQPEFIPDLLLMMAIKIVYAIIAGYLIDGIIHIFTRKKQVLNEYHDKHCLEGEHKDKLEAVQIENAQIEEHIHDGHHEYVEEILKDKHNCQVGHKHKHKNHKDPHCCATNIFLDALQHTAIIIAYVFVATFAISLIKEYCGGLDPLKAVFTGNSYLQILLACLIGLIPNCAGSVFLVELFMEGVIMFPALVAGLSAGAGVGLIVLFTCNYKKIGVNIIIIVLLYALAVLLGIITNFLPIW